MKKIIAVFLTLSVLLGLSACGKASNFISDSSLPGFNSNSESQVIANDVLPDEEANLPENVDPSMSKQEPNEDINQGSDATPPPEGTVKHKFELNLVDADGNSKEGAITFSIYLPETWTVKDNEIFIDEGKISEIHFGILNEDSNAFDKLSSQYADAVASGEFSAGPYTGQYYHMQSEISVSGVTAKKNEIVYCLRVDDKIVSISFYPLFGTGIRAQREEFEAVLNSID